jgi:2-C-methyl-D-erythritol 2,4-cyclodiphosphate synthase
MRIGQGIDAHQLVAGRPLRLGGVDIPHDRGLEGHSDGDALLHAAANSLLGAIGAGDLGRHFPSSDPNLKGIDSREILKRVAAQVRESGFELANLDATIIAQEPRLAAHLDAMANAMAEALDAPRDRINVKVTSTDAMGAIGRAEGIAAQVVVLLDEVDR